MIAPLTQQPGQIHLEVLKTLQRFESDASSTIAALKKGGRSIIQQGQQSQMLEARTNDLLDHHWTGACAAEEMESA